MGWKFFYLIVLYETCYFFLRNFFKILFLNIRSTSCSPQPKHKQKFRYLWLSFYIELLRKNILKIKEIWPNYFSIEVDTCSHYGKEVNRNYEECRPTAVINKNTMKFCSVGKFDLIENKSSLRKEKLLDQHLLLC